MSPASFYATSGLHPTPQAPMKTYTPPQLADLGGVADLTKVAGTASFRDTFLLFNGDTQEANRGSVPSDFGCQDNNRNNVCDFDEGFVPPSRR